MVQLKRVRGHRPLALADARSNAFDYIERFHNPRDATQNRCPDQAFAALTQLSAKSGASPIIGPKCLPERGKSNPWFSDLELGV